MAESGGSFVTAILVVSLALVALAFVFWLMKRRGAGGSLAGRKTQRLAVLDSVAVDTRRRLVLIRRDEVEHLLMIGGPSDIVVESRIGAPQEGKSPLASATHDRARPQRTTEPERERPAAAEPPIVQARPEQFAVERFAERPAGPVVAEANPGSAVATAAAMPPAPANAAKEAPGVRAGNPFDEADFSAVLDAEIEQRSSYREPALRVEPAARQQVVNESRPPAEKAPSRQDSLEEEMARLLSDMTASKRN
jgi:flagellar biogenesis protein FliO